MKTENEIVIWKNPYAIKQGEKFPIYQMRDALDAGGRVTLLIRRAERPSLDRATSSLARACRSRETAGVVRSTLV